VPFGLARIRHHQTNEVTVPLYGPNGNVWSYWNIDEKVITATFEYGPFGELIGATGTEADRHRFRFSTKYEDPVTGFLYYGFRFYNPESGRWLNRDPIQEEGGLNVYGMVGNNPVMRWDYLGLWQIERSSSSAWATVTAESGDTIESLANEIGLDADEASLWLKTLEGDTQDLGRATTEGCRSKIPNTIVVYAAEPSSIFDRMPFGAFWTARKFMWSTADGFYSEGYQIIGGEDLSSKQYFQRLWKTDGVAGYLISGHGAGAPGSFLADPGRSGGGEVFPAEVRPPYKLSIVGAWFCWSAADSMPSVSDISSSPPHIRFWRQHVSSNGLFIGLTLEQTRIHNMILQPDRTFDIRQGGN